MRRALVVLTLVLLYACRPPSVPASAAGALAPHSIDGGTPTHTASTLGAGDMVEIRVFQETELSGMFRVSPEGSIDYPLCGRVKLGGLTSNQASDVITDCLKGGFVKHPQVSVLIREYNSKKIFVFGEVQKPGTFSYEENMNIIQAVTLAGGFTKTASKNATNVTRIIDGRESKFAVHVEDIGVGRERNFLLQPGDIVFIPESFF